MSLGSSSTPPCGRCGRALRATALRCDICGEPVPGAPRLEDAVTSPGDPITAESATLMPATTGAGGDTRPHGPRAGWLVPGQKIGDRYTVIKLLGMGGMGAVYQAWDDELMVAVAIKVIIPTGHSEGSGRTEIEQRFKNELLLARSVTHKNVVRIHDLGAIDGVKYITMSFVEGDDLATVLRRDSRVPVARALRYARQIADGMQAAHEAGVVHRDLKPANVMIDKDDRALIMDFGISATSQESAKGGIIGTLEYMAPEQGAGQNVDGRADIYAFGLILYEMLTGLRSVPPTTQERITAMRERSEKGLAPLTEIDPTMPAPLAALIARCLEKDPAARYQSAGDLAAALAALDDAGELIPIPPRVSRRMLVLAATLVAALLGGSYFFGRSSAPAAPVEIDPVSILIADFDNRSGEPSFSGAVEEQLAIALETASYVSIFSPRDALAIARELKLGNGSGLTEEVGELVARREGIKVLVAGAIDAQGGGYRVQLRARDPATGALIATSDRTVRDRTQMLSTVASMATSVREALGESSEQLAQSNPGETATASSLDAMRAYARGQDLLMTNQFQDALREYEHAVKLDPQFGRAYAGMGAVYASYLKQPDKAEAQYKLALNHLDRMTEREKFRTLGSYYLNVVRNYEKAAENYTELVKLYPADNVGHGSLALAFLLMADVPGAVSEGRKSLEIYPRSTFLRYNYAMYAMYAGEFDTTIAEVQTLRKSNPDFEYALIPYALAKLAQGDRAGAEDGWRQLAALSTYGSSVAKQGLADLQMYYWRPREALALLKEGLAIDAAEKIAAETVPQKHVAAAEAHLVLGDRRQAVAAARAALALSRHESTLFPAARVLLRAGEAAEALAVADDLEKMLQRQTIAYADMIRGEIALQRGQLVDGIERLRAAQKRHPSWFSRFLLGRAYVEAGHFAEAIAELETCLKRRAETTDVFFYDMPTLRYLPELYYWLGRAQQGVSSLNDARKSYEQFLAARTEATAPDPLAADARQRLAAR